MYVCAHVHEKIWFFWQQLFFQYGVNLNIFILLQDCICARAAAKNHAACVDFGCWKENSTVHKMMNILIDIRMCTYVHVHMYSGNNAIGCCC